MAVTTATAMDAIELGEFLAARWTGVLALADAGSVYALPVSYAYDEAGPDLYFRFGFGLDSQKRRYVEGSGGASFVVYDRTDAGWKSVIAEGHLERVSASDLDMVVTEAVDRLRIPYVEVHRRPSTALEFELFRLDIDKLTGVVEAEYHR